MESVRPKSRKEKLDVIGISTTVEADVAPQIGTGVRFWT